MIPVLLVLRIRTHPGRGLRLYLPLILIWVLLAPFALLAVLVLCVVALIKGVTPWRVPVALWQLLRGLRRLSVDVGSPTSAVVVKII